MVKVVPRAKFEPTAVLAIPAKDCKAFCPAAVSKSAAVTNARITATNEIRTLRTVDAVTMLVTPRSRPEHHTKLGRGHLVGREFAG